jgi:hypothetical protein
LVIHIPLGLICAIVGLIAVFSKKWRWRHSTCGRIYFWCLLTLTASATYLSIVRWSENYHLFILGVLSFAFAWFGRTAVKKQRWDYFFRLHITGDVLKLMLGCLRECCIGSRNRDVFARKLERRSLAGNELLFSRRERNIQSRQRASPKSSNV